MPFLFLVDRILNSGSVVSEDCRRVQFAGFCVRCWKGKANLNILGLSSTVFVWMLPGVRQNIEVCCVLAGLRLRWRNRQGKDLSPLRSWVRFSLRTRVKRVRQRSAESRGFSPGTPVSSHRECWLGGLGLAPNWPFHRSCAPWSDMSHKVAARGALCKPSIRSGWAAAFVIQPSSQLQIWMISTPHLLFKYSHHIQKPRFFTFNCIRHLP
jgi:hypothetical protein